MIMEMEVIPFFNAMYASLSETAQSPWLLCMCGIMG